MRKSIWNAITALALVVIAANLTYFNTRKPVVPAVAPQEPVVEVVEVIGRVNPSLDGIGQTDPSYLAKDGRGGLKLVSFHEGSMMDHMPQPPYLIVRKSASGEVSVAPVSIVQKQ